MTISLSEDANNETPDRESGDIVGTPLPKPVNDLVAPKIIYPARRQNSIMRSPEDPRDAFTPQKLAYAVKLLFRPDLTQTHQKVEKFEDLDVDALRHRFRGLVLGLDGTLVSHHNEEFSRAVLEKLNEIREKMKVCVFSNNIEEKSVLQALRIPQVKHAEPKPGVHGFVRAADHYLNLKPQECAMVGDNFLTDGGARQVGMQFIHVKPLEGSETGPHKFARNYGNWVHSVHNKLFGAKQPPRLSK